MNADIINRIEAFELVLQKNVKNSRTARIANAEVLGRVECERQLLHYHQSERDIVFRPVART